MKLRTSRQSFPMDTDPPLVARAKAFLDKAPDGMLYTSDQVAARAACRPRVLGDYASYVAGYGHVVRGKKWWGNKKTIAYIRRKEKDNAKRG